MEQWIVGKPGGPSGPFWSIVSSGGRVIALQIPDESVANEIVALRARVAELEEMNRLERIHAGSIITKRDALLATVWQASDNLELVYNAPPITDVIRMLREAATHASE